MEDRPGMGRARGRGRGDQLRPANLQPQLGSALPQQPQWGPAMPMHAMQMTRAPTPQLPLGRAQSVLPLPTSSGDSTSEAARSSGRARAVPAEIRPDAKRGSLRGKREVEDQILFTKPSNIVSKIGASGTPVSLTANYFRLIRKPSWSLYHYRVDFKPEVHMDRTRRYIMYQLRELLGGYLFDGTQVFVTRKIEDADVIEKVVQGREEQFTVIMKFTRVVSMMDSSSLPILNLILRKAMSGLKLQLVGRNFFDPDATNRIPEFKIELWPGYTTSIRQHESDILLCAEITHKVMRVETIYDIMARVKREERDFQTALLQEVLGTTVLTDYNNKTYRIDDVDFTKKASDTFETKNGPISFIDYYRNRYQINIRDPNQPLIISKAKMKDLRGGQDNTILLVPELCKATGITDKMRADFRTMKAMSEYTRMGPGARVKKLMEFNRRLMRTPDSMDVLREWDLKLDEVLVQTPGRVLHNEKIIFGGMKTAVTDVNVDWTNEFRRNAMYIAIDLKRWYVITTVRSIRETKEFVTQILKASQGMRFPVSEPRYEEIPDDRQNTYSEALERCATNNPQLIMCVVSNNNADRYCNIKKKCCIDRAIPTQVVCLRTITPKAGKPSSSLLSIATKVAIQMNCKIGGAPWLVDLPINGLMTIGYDVCHDAKDKRKSFGALVATMDIKRSTEYFSAVSAHTNGEELSNELEINVTKAVKAYRDHHGELPQRICFYRDGVGEGQVQYVVEHELKALKTKLEDIYAQAGNEGALKLAFIIVSKRINTRMFLGDQNPKPGTVVDDIITLPERYDFYLISQSVRQGTVSPTSYNVVYDTMGLPADRLQMLTYKNTHLYYNWNGTVRVPAVCQYAHKLAFLVGQSIHSSPSNVLEKTLYFL